MNARFSDRGLDRTILDKLVEVANSNDAFALDDMFPHLHSLCETAEKPIVLIIDEIDSATNNIVFLGFLAQLRSDYLEREDVSTFHSVILAGVHDVKNIKYKIRLGDQHKINSPWNIAADFLVNMSFSKGGIAGMLQGYEADHHTGMDVEEMAQLIFDYTSGYPFLVSRFCNLMDERIAGSMNFPDRKFLRNLWNILTRFTRIRQRFSMKRKVAEDSFYSSVRLSSE